MTNKLNAVEGCGKEQPAGAETYVCGQPNARDPKHPWYCRKCKARYIAHLESRIESLEPVVDGLIEAYDRGAETESVSWEELDQLHAQARHVQNKIIEGAPA